MPGLSRIDLHMHTTCSDGTDAPEAMPALARAAGLRLFSVTDHDATAACGIVRDALREGDPRFVAGVEFSCEDGDGKYHILGYGFDPDAPSVRGVVEAGHAQRMARVRLRVKALAARGIAFPEDALDWLYAQPNPGKPHIANLMVRYGRAATVREAIEGTLNAIHTDVPRTAPETAIGGILGGGGIPVLAHPVFGDGRQRIEGEALEVRIRRLMAYGLRGVEAFYPTYTPAQREAVLSIAERHGLLVTAGSDYHGANKTIALGDTGAPASAEMPAGMRRFLEALGMNC